MTIRRAALSCSSQATVIFPAGPRAICGCRGTPSVGTCCRLVNRRPSRDIASKQRQGFGVSRALNESCPYDVDGIRLIDGDGGTILGTTVQHPVVITDADRPSEGSATIRRRCERDVAHVPWINVSPRRDDAAIGARRHRGLAAITDARRDGMSARRVIQPSEEDF